MSKELARGREVELFKKASFLFNKNGYASTSIRQICRAIGIREGSIYHYIDSAAKPPVLKSGKPAENRPWSGGRRK